LSSTTIGFTLDMEGIDMSFGLMEIGAGGVFVVVVLDRVVAILRSAHSKRNGNSVESRVFKLSSAMNGLSSTGDRMESTLKDVSKDLRDLVVEMRTRPCVAADMVQRIRDLERD